MENQALWSTSVAQYLERRRRCGERPTFYQILELDPQCPPENVRKAYYHFSKLLHPDRGAEKGYQELLNDVQVAYDTLGDEYKRMRYNVGQRLLSPKHAARMQAETLELVESKHREFVHANHNLYLRHVAQEYRAGGLVITKALYGNLRMTDVQDCVGHDTVDVEKSVEGPWIDVTVPTALLVQGGMLHANSGTFAHLPGFYNPLHFMQDPPSVEACLYVQYLFGGSLHEATIPDSQPLTVPKRSHRIFGEYVKGPYTLENLEKVISVGSA